MKTTLMTLASAAAVALALTLPLAAQETPKHVPLQKTIGQAKPQVVPSLIVMNAQGATLANGKLTLTGIAPNSIVFADRPVRAAGHAMTKDLLMEWTPDEKGDSFLKDPPNATVSAFGKEGEVIRDAVVVLRKPTLDGATLTFDVDVLEGDLAGADGPASVFIDIIGRPFTPMSFAGVARRTSYRAAWYGAGAVAAGAAVGAAAAAPYAYGYPPPACGYYPYPPCY